MAVTVEQLLQLGRTLASSDDEASLRSAVSRSYYAAYHRALSWESQRVPGSNSGPSGGEHQKLINRLRNPDPGLDEEVRRHSKMTAAKLETLRVRRVTADYAIHCSFTPTEAATQLAQVEAFLLQTV